LYLDSNLFLVNNRTILKELEKCPTTPDGATTQTTFEEINMKLKDSNITVFFKANGINLREAQSWNWSEKHHFEFKENELVVIRKEVSPKEYNAIEIGEN